MVAKALRLGCVVCTYLLGRSARAATQGHEVLRLGKFWLRFKQL